MAFDFTQVDTVVNTAPSGATVTFSSRSLGAADTNRHIVVGVFGAHTGHPTGVTAAGVTATELLNADDAESGSVSFWVAAVPTGTTGDIVVTYSTTRGNCGIALFRMIDGSSTAHATATDTTATTNALSASLEIPSGGAGVAIAVGGAAATGLPTWTWTNLTEQTDIILEGPKSYSTALSTSSGTLTRTAQASSSLADAHMLAMVSFDPLTEQVLTPSLYSDADTFFSPTVTPGEVTLTPSLYSDADTFFSPTVSTDYSLTPSLYSDADTFFSPTIAGGVADLLPSLFVDDDTFFSPTVAGGTVELTASLYSDADTFYSPSVGFGAVDLSPSLVENSTSFFQHRLFGIPNFHPGGDADERVARVVSESRTVEAFD